MKIIFSRKGFDSSSGGDPSPIFPDGRMVSLPIPDKRSPFRYQDICWGTGDLGFLVADLTGGRIPASACAHLDPDLNSGSLARSPDWRPIFGQTGAAQGHLRKNGVQVGDLFLFFGLFRQVYFISGNLAWDKASRPRHVIWGWLQVGEILKVDTCDPVHFGWARYHPHFYRDLEANNTLYIARRQLNLPGVDDDECVGAGVFSHFSKLRQLSACDAASACLWELPTWFFPDEGKSPLTYHTNLERWERSARVSRLKAVSRGQEFILNSQEYPEALQWIGAFFTGSSEQ